MLFKLFKRKHDFDPIPCILETGIKGDDGVDIWLTGLRCKKFGDITCNISSKDLPNLPDDLLYGCKGKKNKGRKQK